MRYLVPLLVLGISASTNVLAQEAGVRSQPYVAVQGEAEIKSRPDVASLTVQVQTRGETLDAAVRAHAPRVAKASGALSGLKATTVSQGSFTAAMEQPPRAPVAEAKDRQPFLPAVATTRFDLEIQPVEGIDGVVDALAGTGVLEVRQVRYRLKDPKAQMREARAAAMRDAADQARVYAEAGGFRLVEVIAVQDGNVRTDQGLQMDLPRAMSASPQAPRMQVSPPATIDTSASVNVTWRIAKDEAAPPR